MEIFNEALEAVEKINQRIYSTFEVKYGMSFPILELQTDGFSIIIKFMGNHQLWFSDEDKRKFFEEANKYEPLEQYLRREAQEIIGQISGIKLLK